MSHPLELPKGSGGIVPERKRQAVTAEPPSRTCFLPPAHIPPPSPAPPPLRPAEALVSRPNYSNHPGKGGALGSWVPSVAPPFPSSFSPLCPRPSLSGVRPANERRDSRVWPGSRGAHRSPPHSSGRGPGAHGRGSSFLRCPLARALPPAPPPLRVSRSSSSSSRRAPHGSG